MAFLTEWWRNVGLEMFNYSCNVRNIDTLSPVSQARISDRAKSPGWCMHGVFIIDWIQNLAGHNLRPREISGQLIEVMNVRRRNFLT